MKNGILKLHVVFFHVVSIFFHYALQDVTTEELYTKKDRPGKMVATTTVCVLMICQGNIHVQRGLCLTLYHSVLSFNNPTKEFI